MPRALQVLYQGTKKAHRPRRMSRLSMRERGKSQASEQQLPMLYCPECEIILRFEVGAHWAQFPICPGGGLDPMIV